MIKTYIWSPRKEKEKKQSKLISWKKTKSNPPTTPHTHTQSCQQKKNSRKQRKKQKTKTTKNKNKQMLKTSMNIMWKFNQWKHKV
jgi:hypothetical protein